MEQLIQQRQDPVAYVLAHVHLNSVILDSVGRGEYFYVASVTRSWRLAYARAAAGWFRYKRLGAIHAELAAEIVDPKATTYRAVFGSPSRLKMANEYGITAELSKIQVFGAAGTAADVPTLQLACELGMRVQMEVANIYNPVAHMFRTAARAARRDTIRPAP